MNDKNKYIIVNFLLELLDLYEFELWVDTNSNSENIFRLNDMQGANWSWIEQDEFHTLADVVERLDSPHNDYIYRSLEERMDAKEHIPKDDWDLTAKRYLESDTVAKILNDIDAKEYKEIISKKQQYEFKNLIEILDKDEQFYKSVCKKYVNTMSKEMLLETDDKILHIFIEDKYIDLKESGKINNQNYKDYLDGNFEVYEYNFYQELYNSTIKSEIAYDLNDLELFNSNNEWDFYITFEELKKIGYGFMVKDQYPLIEKYAVSSENIFDFFNYFSLEQLDDFEESLRMYFLENSITYNEYEGLTVNPISHFEAKESYSFNSDILRLACGLTTYEDFIEDYTKQSQNYYDKSLSKVIEYFKENEIKDLMDYGSDGDEGLYHLSSLYEEIMDKLNIDYEYVYTEDVSDGKYLTTVIFKDDSEIKLDTSAWNGKKVVAENITSIYEKYNDLQKSSIENEIEDEISY